MLHRAVALSSAAVACSALSEEYVRGNGPLLWANFKQEHGKKYGAGEEARRYDVFMTNMAAAARLEKPHRAGNDRDGNTRGTGSSADRRYDPG
eukprot:gene32633-15763_t